MQLSTRGHGRLRIIWTAHRDRTHLGPPGRVKRPHSLRTRADNTMDNTRLVYVGPHHGPHTFDHRAAEPSLSSCVFLPCVRA
eukprot:1345658-Prymnesium_polylepis.2